MAFRALCCPEPTATVHSCPGCSLHKHTGSELVGVEIQASLQSLHVGLQGCIFPQGCLLLILTNVPYGQAPVRPQLPLPCSDTFRPPATRGVILGLKEQHHHTPIPHTHLHTPLTWPSGTFVSCHRLLLSDRLPHPAPQIPLYPLISCYQLGSFQPSHVPCPLSGMTPSPVWPVTRSDLWISVWTRFCPSSLFQILGTRQSHQTTLPPLCPPSSRPPLTLLSEL